MAASRYETITITHSETMTTPARPLVLIEAWVNLPDDEGHKVSPVLALRYRSVGLYRRVIIGDHRKGDQPNHEAAIEAGFHYQGTTSWIDPVVIDDDFLNATVFELDIMASDYIAYGLLADPTPETIEATAGEMIKTLREKHRTQAALS